MTISLNYILIGIAMLITLGSQVFINSKYKTTSKIKNNKDITGKEVARIILDKNNLKNVKINEVSGTLSDHYDPRNKTVNLSSDIYNGNTIAAISVASHECGHAIQDKNGYLFLRFRNSIVPLVNFASRAGYIAILIGLFTSWVGFIWIGILLEVVILLFQVVTLPVEFNASDRALKQIEKLDLVTKKEKNQCKGMLTAAALTYVASVATAILEIVRLILVAKKDD